MADLIIVGGAPGSGKSTISSLLRDRLKSPYIDFGWLREFHMEYGWTNASPEEENMAFENVLYIVRNYFRHGYTNVILTDLEDFRIAEIPIHFRYDDFVIATLVVHDDEELKRRVLIPERDSGYRDFASSIAWNRSILERPNARNEHKIDNTCPDPLPALEAILALLR
jgi:hypothetical protein